MYYIDAPVKYNKANQTITDSQEEYIVVVMASSQMSDVDCHGRGELIARLINEAARENENINLNE